MQGINFIQDLAIVVLLAGVVGWICQRLRLSVIVGYLAAGMLVGPYTPPFTLVSDIGRISTLAQVGLVFLMFSIGMRLSLRKLRRLGFALVAATLIEANVVYNLSRLAGTVLGWSRAEGLFLAGMLMVSSSAVISKVLQDAGLTHEKTGQYAMGVVVVEDIVAVVMLTLLGSFVQFGHAGAARLSETIGLLAAFVALAGITGLLLVPWLLRRLSRSAAEELQTLLVAGLLLTMALLAERAGYSLALGAFLLGAIVAETPHRTQVDRAFEGLRDVFSAVFFVAIGMEIDPRQIAAHAGLIVAIAALTVVARVAACTLGLLAVGSGTTEALRVGLTVTPIGEFSFIIAQLGVSAGVVPDKFYPLAVGVSLLTTLAAPVLTRRSDGISVWLVARQPGALRAWTDYYRQMLERLQLRARRNRLWQLSRRRFVQIGVEILFVTGLLVFSENLFTLAEGYLGRAWLFPYALEVLFWSALVVVVLAPLVAIWRNISALALLYAEVSTAGLRRAAVLRPVVETGLKAVAATGLFLWLSAVMPLGGATRWLLLAITVLAVVALVVFWRRLIYWHSELEVELNEVLAGAGQHGSATAAPWLRPREEWHLNISECLLPDLADCRGRTLTELALRAQFGCSVVGIERQGFMIANPPPETVLYPRDRLLLLGSGPPLAAARRLLTAVSGAELAAGLDEMRMEPVTVPARSRCAGRTLAALAPTRRSGVQIAAINRGGRRLVNPGADEQLCAGDEVLVLGNPAQIAAFRNEVCEEPAADAPPAGGPV
ncbi:MAG TPA: cation:proton antiporter [Opitutaceae bacterium]|nr:cation:proton antiporter [Opitutaceae bacterium]